MKGQVLHRLWEHLKVLGWFGRFKTRSKVSKSTYLVRWIAENVFAVITFIGTFPNRSCTLVDLEDSNSTNIITTSFCLSFTLKKPNRLVKMEKLSKTLEDLNTLCRFLSMFQGGRSLTERNTQNVCVFPCCFTDSRHRKQKLRVWFWALQSIWNLRTSLLLRRNHCNKSP